MKLKVWRPGIGLWVCGLALASSSWAHDLEALTRAACQQPQGQVTVSLPVNRDGRDFYVALSRALPADMLACAAWLEVAAGAKVVATTQVYGPVGATLSAPFFIAGFELPLTAIRYSRGGFQSVDLRAAGREATGFLLSAQTSLPLLGTFTPCREQLTVERGECGGATVIEANGCENREATRRQVEWDATAHTFKAHQPFCKLEKPITLFSMPAPPFPPLTLKDDGMPMYPEGTVSKVRVLFSPQNNAVPPEGEIRWVLEVQRPDLERGTRTDVDAFGISGGALRRLGSGVLERGPRGTCAPEVRWSGTFVNLRSCLEGVRKESDFPVPRLSPALEYVEQQNVDALYGPGEPPRCEWVNGVKLCSIERAAQTTWFTFKMSGLAPLPELTGAELVDGPFVAGSRLHFALRRDGKLKTVMVNLDSLDSQIVLKPVAALGGYATSRRRFSNGVILQTQSVCSEFGASLPGALFFPSGNPRVLGVPSGDAQERGGWLLIDSTYQVGSDGSGDEGGETERLPRGAKFPFPTGNGAFVVAQVVAVNLATRTVVNAGWDTHAPFTAGTGRFVVLFRHLAAGKPQQVERWEPATGTVKVLGLAKDAGARLEGDEVQVNLLEQSLSVNASTGEQRVLRKRVTLPPAATPPPNLAKEHLGGWLGPRGEAVLTGDELPSAGGCGVAGFWFEKGVLFTDRGAFAWPKKLPPPQLE